MSIFHNNILGGAAGQGGDFTIERSLRFHNHDSSYLSRTYGSGNNRKFTVSAWLKRTPSNTSEAVILGCRQDSNNRDWFGFESDELVAHHRVNGTTRSAKVTDRKFRDFSAWYHIVYAFNSTLSTQNDRTKFYVNGERQTVSTYNGAIGYLENVTMNLNNITHYIGVQNTQQGGYTDFNLTEVHFIDDQELDADDFGEYDDNNVWQPKKYEGTYGTTGWYLNFSDNSNVNALGQDQRSGVTHAPTGSTYGIWESGTPATILDGSTSTGANLRPYSSLSGQGTGVTLDTGITASSSIRIYGSSESGNYEINGTNYNSAPSFPNHAWTTLTGISFPITVNSFGLDGGNTGNGGYIFAIEIDGTVLGSNATANDWAVTNFSVSSGSGNDSLIDTPTDYTAASGNNGGNYCTLNPLQYNAFYLRNGALDIKGHNGAWRGAAGTFPMFSGKWYFEYDTVVSNEHLIGIVPASTYILNTMSSYAYGSETGGKYIPGTSNISYGSSWGTGDVIGVAFDADNGTLTFYKNGTSQGTAFTGLTDGPYLPSVVLNGQSRTASLNFGQRPFTHTPPSGYKSLCTANLTDPTIEKGSDYFDVKTYSGTGSSQSISGLGFSPDLVWIKNRSQNDTHAILDTHRGTNTVLSSNLTNGDRTESGSVTAFNSDGFTVGGYNDTNRNNSNFVAWTWDAGSGSPSTLTSGTMNSSVRVNTSAGFSICTYTSPNSSNNQSFAHGLNAKPDFVIVKNRDSSYNYDIYHSSLGYNSSLIFTGAATRSGAFSAEPTSTVVNTRHDYTHVNTDDYIAYCWTAVEGYSAFGSYTGNGNSDGPFVVTGFRPRWIMVKASSSASYGNWVIHDTARSSYNESQKNLYANLSNLEDTSYKFDILSNGFKIRSSSYDGHNGDNKNYIYVAFAEHPFKTARAR
jgi:hypothetical protein